MDVSPRDFFKVVSTGAATGTAIGGLAGLGVNLAAILAHAQELRIKDARTVPSICPYCSVGCATLGHTIDGKIVNIEGDPNRIGRFGLAALEPATQADRSSRGAGTYASPRSDHQ